MQEGYAKYLKAGMTEGQGKCQGFIRGMTLASQSNCKNASWTKTGGSKPRETKGFGWYIEVLAKM